RGARLPSVATRATGPVPPPLWGRAGALMPAELEATPFLRSRPPWFARTGSLLIVALCAAVGWFSVAVPLPDVVVAPFELRPPTSRSAITIPAAGVVTRVLVDEGDPVERHQVLVRVSAPGAALARGAGLRLERLRDELALLDGKERRTLGVFDARLRALEPEADQHEASLPLLRQTARLAAQQRQSAEALHRKGLLTAVQLQDERAVEVRARLELQAGQSALSRADAERTRILAERELEQAELQTQRRRLREELDALEAEMPGHRGVLGFADDGELVARSPCRGTVSERRVTEAGQSVGPGQAMMLVHCEDDVLLATVHLPQSKLPLVHEGLAVKLMYDALPYERWG